MSANEGAMSRITAWLEHSDMSSEELGELGCEELLRRFEATDWDAELAMEEQLASNNRACGPAAMGMALPDGHALHLSPGRAGTLLWHAHYPRTFWQRLFNEPVEVVPAVGTRDEAPDLIRLFFAADYEGLRDRARRRPLFSTRADEAHR